MNNTQPFNATILDTAGKSLTGLTLTYQSSNPATIPAATGSITPTYPSSATITAVCQPPTCNPGPSTALGYNGNGKPIASNGINVVSGGSVSSALYVASTNSQYIYPIDYSTGTTGNLVKLPYIPNSMVMSVDGSTIWMGGNNPTTISTTYPTGGPGALMEYSTSSNAVSATFTTVPGTVLSVSPNGTSVVVTDSSRGTVSLVSSAGSVATYYGATATHASWSPDSTTLYVTTNTNLVLMYSTNTNWQPVTLTGTDTTYNDVVTMVPAIGAYFAGSPNTDGRSYCSTTTTTGTSTPPTTSNAYVPIADSQAVKTDRLATATTTGGLHILGASTATGVSDLYLPSAQLTAATDCTTATAAVTFTSTPSTKALSNVTPTTITGVQPASNGEIAFVTFTGTGNGVVPYYLTNATAATGTLQNFTLSTASGTPTAPVAGTWASDDDTFYLGTAGDNVVHLITVSYPTSGTPTLTDSSQLAPALPNLTNSGTATPNLIVQRPRKVRS